jgi:hypothetical protein
MSCATGSCATAVSDADNHSFYLPYSHSVGVYHFLSNVCLDSNRMSTHNIPWTQQVGEALHNLADRSRNCHQPGQYYNGLLTGKYRVWTA